MDQDMRRRVVQLMADITGEIDTTTAAGKALQASIEAMLRAMDAYMAAGTQPHPWDGIEP